MKVRIGELLRHWRAIRGVSQRHLAERAGVSTRHLAFVENGRAHPSRDAVIWLARALKVPEDEELAFLEAAGYLAEAAEASLDPELVRHIDRSLAALEPHPALIHDLHGTIIAVNETIRRLCEPYVGDVTAFIGDRSGGHRLVAALGPYMVDTGHGLKAHYLRRVRDALLRGHGTPAPHLVALFERLAAKEDVDDDALDRRNPHPLLVRLAVERPGERLDFEVLTTTLGTPMAMSLRALRLVILLQAETPSPAPHGAG
jgi:transcriptional regulator with XRE-family HTH domain